MRIGYFYPSVLVVSNIKISERLNYIIMEEIKKIYEELKGKRVRYNSQDITGVVCGYSESKFDSLDRMLFKLDNQKLYEGWESRELKELDYNHFLEDHVKDDDKMYMSPSLLLEVID